MKKLVKIFSFLALVPFIASAGDYKEVNAEELVELKKQGKVVVVDSRSDKYIEGKKIEGAVIISTDNLTEESLSHVASKEDKIVFYCSNVNCAASAKAAAKASSFGYTSLYKYPGGYDEWVEKGLPVESI